MIKEFLKNRENKIKPNIELRERIGEKLFSPKSNKLFEKILIPAGTLALVTIIIIALNTTIFSNKVDADNLLSKADSSIISLLDSNPGEIIHMTVNSKEFYDNSIAFTQTAEIWTDLSNFRTHWERTNETSIPYVNSDFDEHEYIFMMFDELTQAFTLYTTNFQEKDNEFCYSDGTPEGTKIGQSALENYYIGKLDDIYSIPDEGAQPDYSEEESSIRKTNTFAGLPVDEQFYNTTVMRSLRGCDDCYATSMESEVVETEIINGEESYKIESKYPEEIRNMENAPDETKLTLTTWISKETGLLLKREISTNGILLLEQEFTIETIEKPNVDFFTYEDWKSQNYLKDLQLFEQ